MVCRRSCALFLAMLALLAPKVLDSKVQAEDSAKAPLNIPGENKHDK